MLLQSTSSYILNQYTALLEKHMIVISFLTSARTSQNLAPHRNLT